ncbi:hypothetical protein N8197_01555 [bacterium]|nr:hypothetical protein [bacterium]
MGRFAKLCVAAALAVTVAACAETPVLANTEREELEDKMLSLLVQSELKDCFMSAAMKTYNLTQAQFLSSDLRNSMDFVAKQIGEGSLGLKDDARSEYFNQTARAMELNIDDSISKPSAACVTSVEALS